MWNDGETPRKILKLYKENFKFQIHEKTSTSKFMLTQDINYAFSHFLVWVKPTKKKENKVILKNFFMKFTVHESSSSSDWKGRDGET